MAKQTKPKTTTQHHKHVKTISLALQGGGAEGSFTWGVLDELLTQSHLHIEAITGTSAGAINGVVLVHGLINGGREEAQKLLREFWRKVSISGALSPMQPTLLERMWGGKMPYSPTKMAMDYWSTILSPYQINYFDLNPLRDILEEMIDFEMIRKNKQIKIFINATSVRTGKIKIFETKHLTLDMVMASACLPFIYKTVYVDGEPYWDGGYCGNPALFPLFYKTACKDIVLVQINPLVNEDVPTTAGGIMDRVNEISFNSNLMQEMRAIEFVRKLIDDNKLNEDTYKRMRVHMIEAQEIMRSLDYASKFNTDWNFLEHLHDVGIQATTDWVAEKLPKVGVESSIDVKELFL